MRAVVAGLAGAVAVLGLMAGTTGMWAMAVASDSDRVERRVDDLLARPEVSDALARRAVEMVGEVVDVRSAVDELVPDALVTVTDLLLAGVRTRVEDQVGELIRRDQTRRIVAAAAGRAHAGVIDLLRGDGLVDGLRVADGEVRVNVLPLVGLVVEAFQQVGLFSDVVVPELSVDGDPDEQRRALAAALDRPLPDDFGELVVYRSVTLERAGASVTTAQHLVVIAHRTAWLLVVGSIALAAAAIVLARRRWRAGALVASGLIGMIVIVQLATRRLTDRVAAVVDDPGARLVVADLVGGLQRSLIRVSLMSTVLAVTFVVAVVVAAPQLVARRRGTPAADAP